MASFRETVSPSYNLFLQSPQELYFTSPHTTQLPCCTSEVSCKPGLHSCCSCAALCIAGTSGDPLSAFPATAMQVKSVKLPHCHQITPQYLHIPCNVYTLELLALSNTYIWDTFQICPSHISCWRSSGHSYAGNTILLQTKHPKPILLPVSP